MKIFSRVFFLFAGFIFFEGCDSSIFSLDIKGANIFYTSLSKSLGGIQKQNDNFSSYFRQVAPLAKKHPDYQMEIHKIDSLSIYYATFSSDLDHSIKELKRIKEFDKDFSMVKLSIGAYQAIKNGYDSVLPSYLQVYKNGWASSLNYEKERILSSSEILHRAAEISNRKIDSLSNQVMKFIKKYEIKY